MKEAKGIVKSPDKEIWKVSESEALKLYKTSRKGLSDEEAATRLLEYGKNEIPREEKKTGFSLFLSNFKSYLIIILIIAGLVTLFMGDIRDSFIIFLVVILNAVIGYLEERKAEGTIEALKQYNTLYAWVKRGGKSKKIRAEAVVPGDIVILEEGSKLPADGRFIFALDLKLDESTLTGESVFADKSANSSEASNQIEADNLGYMGTIVTSGRAHLLVTTTGQKTEFGKITLLSEEGLDSVSPLQMRMKVFSKQLAIAVFLICSSIFFLGILLGESLLNMFKLSVSLAVSAIPEGLPVAITVILVIGMKKMAKKKAIVRRLSAVETLGTASVIASDKTGTLTHNKLAVTEVYADKHYCLEEKGNKEIALTLNGIKAGISNHLSYLMKIASLANDAEEVTKKGGVEILGDPTDSAILYATRKLGISRNKEAEENKRLDEIPFSSDRKYLATLNKSEKDNIIILKGAHELVLNRCDQYYEDEILANKLAKDDQVRIEKEASEMTERGLRVVALAIRITDKEDIELSDVENNKFIFVGLIGMKDSFRAGTRESIEKCKQAGIKVIMLTGDHLDTARTIGHDLKILYNENEAILASELEKKSISEIRKILKDVTVVARMRPEVKYRIIEAFQADGSVVAMTGDGVNDVPALQKADIGVAMGRAGSDAAKEAAEIVLVDDNFSTIVAAIEGGRTIFENIRKVLFYLLSTSLGEIMTVVGGLVLGLPLVLLPIQILWINMVTDTGATIPLGLEPEEEDHLKKPPRKSKEPLVGRLIIRRSILVGLVMAVLSLSVFVAYLDQGLDYARTMAFFVLVVTQWFNSFSARSEKRSIFSINFWSNKSLILGLGLVILAQIVVMTLPFFREGLGLTALGLRDIIFAVYISTFVIIAVEVDKMITRLIHKN